MTRDVRKRWRWGIALVATLVGMLGLTALLRALTLPRPGDEIGPAVLHETGPLGPPAPNASLVVTEHSHHGSENRNRVLRFDFKNGRPQPPETLWEGSDNRFGSLGAQPIFDNRYLVSWRGSVVDLREKTFIHEGAGKLIEVRGDRVVSGFCNSAKHEKLVAFNLRTRTIEKLTDHEAESLTLPDHRSPDGTTSVSAIHDRLTLRRVGYPPMELGRFEVEPGKRPPDRSNPPVLWLNKERFLTQDGNGQLIAVGLGGARVPMVQIPVKDKNSSWSHLSRDADGRIIYSCGSERFFVNADAKTWERCDWVSLGHGFEESSQGDGQLRRVYRYKGTEIARAPFWTRQGPYEALATDGFIAVFIEHRLLVWSAGTGDWTALDVPFGQIAGWVK